MSATKNFPKFKKSDLPFSEQELLNILRIVDVALADEELEKGVCKWLNILHEPINLEVMEELHKKVNIFLQEKSKY